MLDTQHQMYSPGGVGKYSARNTLKAVSFFLTAPHASQVSLAGDFNGWHPIPMRREVDGTWHLQVTLHHGHHMYWFLVDGQPMLDPHSQGTVHNERNEKVSLIAVS